MKTGGRPKKKPEERADAKVELRLEAATLKRVDSLARAWGWSRSHFMRVAVKDFADRARRAA